MKADVSLLKRRTYQRGCLDRKSRKKGPDVWVLRYWKTREDGSLTQASHYVGTIDEYPTKADARAATDAFRLSLNADNPRQRPVPFRALVDRYIADELPERRKLTQQGYMGVLQNHILPRWRGQLITEVHPFAVDRWLHNLERVKSRDKITMQNSLFPKRTAPVSSRLSPSSKRGIKSLMKRLFDRAMLWNLIPVQRNPISLLQIHKGDYQEKERRIISLEEFQLLLEQPELSYDPFRTMVICAMGLGLRCSELFGLKWDAIDWAALKVRVEVGVVQNHVGGVKTISSRATLPLAPELASVLKNWKQNSPYPQETDWVFACPHQGGKLPYTPGGVQKRHLNPAARRIGLGDSLGWHTFRHTYATLLCHLGVNVKVLQRLMRHKKLQTTLDIYTHDVPEDLRSGNQTLANVLFGGKKRKSESTSRKKLRPGTVNGGKAKGSKAS